MKKIISYLRHHYQEIYKISLFALSIVAIIYFFPNEAKFKYEFQKGKPWRHKDLIAPTAFPIQKSEETIKKKKNEILKDLRPYFEYNDEIYPDNRPDLISEFKDNWQSKYPEISFNSNFYKNHRKRLLRLYDSIGQHGLIEIDKTIKNQFDGNSLYLIKNKVAKEYPFSHFFTSEHAEDFIRNNLNNTTFDSSIVANSLLPYLQQNIIYAPEKTAQERKNLISRISLTNGMVQKGELVVSQGEPVDEETYQLLISLKKEYEESLLSDYKYNSIIVGQIILVSISILMLVLFLYYFWPDVFDNNRKIILILLMLILMVFLTSWISNTFSSIYIYLLPICILPIVIRAFFDTRLALFVHLIAIILISFIVPNSFEFVFLQLIAGIITIITIVDLQKRSQFFVTSIFIFLSYSLTYVGMTLLTSADIKTIEPVQFAMFAGSALITMFAYPLVYIMEKLLGLITDVSLMEYSDSNSKLLRKLAEKAPGTFQHSIQVANISEDVVHSIGGSVLLVRTGSLYHDIGKMLNPMYFIENQNGNYNPHEEVNNLESARILIDHVTEGIEIAKKHKLPEQIIDFIRTHHGTKKVDYFYRMEKNENPDEEIDVTNFQYHGPKPFSKETAIVMMADSVEAASRSLKEPTEQNISNLVDKIINQQMQEDQFFNADITFSDISVAKKIIKRKLHNMYHVRIEYPD
ncbi:MAG: HDIG domain-containing protein [Bacteroidales bacterium]|nr:HDIG domain-containing protein [Bacteroidales bacterium]